MGGTPTRGVAMRVYVRYMYPIYAEVDLDEQDVVSVVVDDEHPSQPVDFLDDEFRPAPTELRDRALQIAESMTWPSWDYGW